MSLETIEPLGSRGGNTGSKNLSKDIIMIYAIFYVLIVKIAVRRIHILRFGGSTIQKINHFWFMINYLWFGGSIIYVSEELLFIWFGGSTIYGSEDQLFLV